MAPVNISRSIWLLLLAGAFLVSLAPSSAQAGAMSYLQCPSGVSPSQATINRIQDDLTANIVLNPDPGPDRATVNCWDGGSLKWLRITRNSSSDIAANRLKRIVFQLPGGGSVMNLVGITGRINACRVQSTVNNRIVPQFWAQANDLASSTTAPNPEMMARVAPIAATTGTIGFTAPNSGGASGPCGSDVATPSSFAWNNQASITGGLLTGSVYNGTNNMSNAQAGVGIGLMCGTVSGGCGASSGQHISIANLRITVRDLVAPTAEINLDNTLPLGDWGQSFNGGSGSAVGASNSTGAAAAPLVSDGTFGTGIAYAYTISTDGVRRNVVTCDPGLTANTSYSSLPLKASPCPTSPNMSSIGITSGSHGFQEGLNQIRAGAEDYANNPDDGAFRSSGFWAASSGESASVFFVLDNTAPQPLPYCFGTNGENGWLLNDVQCTYSASDANAGARLGAVAGFKSSANPLEFAWLGLNPLLGVQQSAAFAGVSRPPSGVEGTLAFELRATDAFGNRSAKDLTTVKIDLTNPTVAPLVCPAATGNNDWYLADFSCNLTVTDQASRPQNGEYQFASTTGSWTTGALGGAVSDVSRTGSSPSISAEGTTVVNARGVDFAGRKSAISSTTVKLDKTNPTVAAPSCTTLDGSNGWNLTNVTCSLSVTDSISKPEKAEYRFNSTGSWLTPTLGGLVSDTTRSATAPAISTEGTTTINARGSDFAGRASMESSTTVKIDKTNPTVAAPSCPTATGSNGWHLADVSCSISVTDSISKPEKAEYRLNSTGSWLTPTLGGLTSDTTRSATAPAISTEGTTVLNARGSDFAGRVSTESSTTVKIDKSNPTVASPSCPAANGLNGWHISDVTCRLTVTDAISKPEKVEYRFNSAGAWASRALEGVSSDSSRSANLPSISTEGTSVLNARGSDFAGRISAEGSATLKIDKSNPQVSIGPVPAYYRQPTALPVTITDPVSGVSTAQYCVSQQPGVCPSGVWTSLNPTTTGPSSFSPAISPVETSYVLIKASDRAGNESAITSQEVKIDSVAPTLEVIGDYPAWTNDRELAGRIFRASDQYSGVERIDWAYGSERAIGDPVANCQGCGFSTSQSNSNYDLIISGQAFSSGSREIVATAYDRAGNPSAPKSTFLQLDFIAPEISSLDVLERRRSDRKALSAEVTDLLSGPGSVTFQYCRDNCDSAQSWQPIDQPSCRPMLSGTSSSPTSKEFSCAVDLLALGGPTVNLRARGLDVAGNESYSGAVPVAVPGLCPI